MPLGRPEASAPVDVSPHRPAGGAGRPAMNDPDRQVFVADVDDLDRPIDTWLAIDGPHFFVGDVSGRAGRLRVGGRAQSG